MAKEAVLPFLLSENQDSGSWKQETLSKKEVISVNEGKRQINTVYKNISSLG